MNEFETKPVSGNEDTLDPATQHQLTGTPDPDSPGFYRTNRFYLWAIFFALIIIGVLVYFVFFARSSAPLEKAKINFTIQVPEQVPSNGEVIFKFIIENKDTRNLSGGKLEVVYPSGAIYLQSTPTASNSAGTLFPVPELVAGQNAAILVKLKLQGGVGDDKQISARYYYRYSGLSSEFFEETKVSTLLKAQDVGLEWSGPGQTSVSQLVVYTLKYKNSSKQNLSQARIKVLLPDGFALAGTEPKADIGVNTWQLGELMENQEGSITFQGSFMEAKGGETKNFQADLLVLGANGAYFTQGSAEFSTLISSTPLNLEIIRLNSNDSNVMPGDTLSFLVKYANTAPRLASGVNIQVTIDSKAVDYGDLQAEGAIISGNTLIWNASSDGALESLAPNSRGEFGFSVSIKNPATRDNSQNLLVNLTSQITAREYSSPFPGSNLSLKVGTIASLSASLPAFSGVFPPKVGQTTGYTVSFNIRNATNNLSDVQVVGYLNIDPNSFDKSSLPLRDASSVKFENSTGKITWNVGTVPAGSGIFAASRNLQFKINFIPQASHAGKTVVLIKNITLVGKDTFTGNAVNLSIDNLTTQEANEGDGGIVEN